jgi:hypothetical protein
MKNLFNSPFKGIVEDFKSRKACYNQDWSNALCSGPRYIRYVHDHFNNLNFFSFICFFLPPTNIGFDCFDIWMFMSGYWLQQLICSLLLLFLLSLLASNLAKKQVLTYFKEVFICVLRLYLSHTHTHTQSPEWSWFLSSDGSLSTVHTLASTAICGIIHSLFGGQPLLILGVAEPTVIMYSYLYSFAKGNNAIGKELYLAWVGW